MPRYCIFHIVRCLCLYNLINYTSLLCCQVNIGLMVLHGSSLKPFRGKTLLLSLRTDVEAPDLLKQAVQKMRTFHKEMVDEPYILLYPDGSEVVDLPGSDRPFKLAEYKRRAGKPYNRITFFICLEAHFRQGLWIFYSSVQHFASLKWS